MAGTSMNNIQEDDQLSQLTEYYSARSRSSSVDSDSDLEASLAPLGDAQGAIGVSNCPKRGAKDMKIYVNQRTGLPIRPPTSFALFKFALRRTIQEGKVNFFDFNRRSTQQWIRMSDEEKAPYVERAKILADHFRKIEVQYLRRKVRQLKAQVKSIQLEKAQSSSRRQR